MMTVRDILAKSHAALRRARLSYGHGTDNAWDEAVYLVTYGLGLDPGRLDSTLDRTVDAPAVRRVERLIAKRIELRVPAAYLTREAWLGDLRFYVDARVIVPRSFIAELLREQLRPWIRSPRSIRRALDLCTGSGCLAVMLARAFTRAQIVATDISAPALAVARHNVKAYGLSTRVQLKRADLFSGLPAGRYNLIVSNPPYVAARAMRALPPEHRSEPQVALAGGRDGFDAVRVILEQAAAHLERNGLLVVEIGHHRAELERALPYFAFVWLDTSAGDDCVFMLGRDDLLAGLERATRARKRMPEANDRATRAGVSSRRRSALDTGRA